MPSISIVWISKCCILLRRNDASDINNFRGIKEPTSKLKITRTSYFFRSCKMSYFLSRLNCPVISREIWSIEDNKIIISISWIDTIIEQKIRSTTKRSKSMEIVRTWVSSRILKIIQIYSIFSTINYGIFQFSTRLAIDEIFLNIRKSAHIIPLLSIRISK